MLAQRKLRAKIATLIVVIPGPGKARNPEPSDFELAESQVTGFRLSPG